MNINTINGKAEEILNTITVGLHHPQFREAIITCMKDFAEWRLEQFKTEQKQSLMVGEDMICPITKEHCDDDCCTVGATCNLSDMEATEEYAEQVAIGFNRWCDENEYACNAGLGRTLTKEELYNYYANNIFPIK